MIISRFSGRRKEKGGHASLMQRWKRTNDPTDKVRCCEAPYVERAGLTYFYRVGRGWIHLRPPWYVRLTNVSFLRLEGNPLTFLLEGV